MAKFKPFHEFQKPLMGYTPEAFLDYIDTAIPKDHLCRLVKEVVFSLDTEATEANYSFIGQRTYHPCIIRGHTLISDYHQQGFKSSELRVSRKAAKDAKGFIPQLNNM